MTYYQSSTSCQPCSSLDINCIVCGYSTGTTLSCTQCSNTSYLYLGQCYTACPSKTYPSLTPSNICVNCSANCLNCTANGCSQCETNYVVSLGQCSSSCPQGYYIDTVGSISTCVTCGSNCLACSSSSICTSCSQPYALAVNNTCS